MRRSRIATVLVLAAALGGASALVAACGGGGDDNKSSTTTTSTTQQASSQGAAGHFQDALAALEAGDLTGPEGVNKHLDEAISLSGDLPQAEQHAKQAKQALVDGNLKSAREHIQEGLKAAQQKPSTGAASTAVKVSLGEYFIKPSSSSVAAGPVKFTVTNDGKIEHEFVVLQTDTAPGKLIVKKGEVTEDAYKSPGEIGGVKPKKTSDLVLNLKAGKYVFICNLAGHYQAGQHVGFTVK